MLERKMTQWITRMIDIIYCGIPQVAADTTSENHGSEAERRVVFDRYGEVDEEAESPS